MMLSTCENSSGTPTVFGNHTLTVPFFSVSSASALMPQPLSVELIASSVKLSALMRASAAMASRRSAVETLTGQQEKSFSRLARPSPSAVCKTPSCSAYSIAPSASSSAAPAAYSSPPLSVPRSVR